MNQRRRKDFLIWGGGGGGGTVFDKINLQYRTYRVDVAQTEVRAPGDPPPPVFMPL